MNNTNSTAPSDAFEATGSSPPNGADPHVLAYAEHVAALSAAERDLANRFVNQYVLTQAPAGEIGPDIGGAVDLAAAMRGELEPVPTFAFGVIAAESIHWLFGKPDSGKSTIAIHASIEWIEDTGGRVLYVDREKGAQSTAKRFREAGMSPETAAAHVDYRWAPSMPATPEGRAALLAAVGDANVTPTLLVIDSASRALSAADLSDNDTGDVVRFADELLVPARDAGASVVVIDHVPHSDPNRMRGNGAKMEVSDVVWQVRKRAPFDRETMSS